MSTIPTSRSQLLAMGATAIAEATSHTLSAQRWTELSLWWIDDGGDRPFIGVIEGRSSNLHDDQKFRCNRFGSMSRALSFFDPSDLFNDLVNNLPEDVDTIYPDANALRAKRAAENRGYSGDNLTDALAWLYEGEDLPTRHDIAKAVERDFGVPWRTVTNGMIATQLTGWGRAFIPALRYFDRNKWRRERETGRA